MTETEKLIQEVREWSNGEGFLYRHEVVLAAAAPKLARLLQKAIEQRDRAILGRASFMICDTNGPIRDANAELDAIAEGK